MSAEIERRILLVLCAAITPALLAIVSYFGTAQLAGMTAVMSDLQKSSNLMMVQLATLQTQFASDRVAQARVERRDDLQQQELDDHEHRITVLETRR